MNNQSELQQLLHNHLKANLSNDKAIQMSYELRLGSIIKDYNNSSNKDEYLKQAREDFSKLIPTSLTEIKAGSAILNIYKEILVSIQKLLEEYNNTEEVVCGINDQGIISSIKTEHEELKDEEFLITFLTATSIVLNKQYTEQENKIIKQIEEVKQHLLKQIDDDYKKIALVLISIARYTLLKRLESENAEDVYKDITKTIKSELTALEVFKTLRY